MLVNGSTDACSRGTKYCSFTIYNSSFTNNTNTAVYLVTDGFDFDLQRSMFVGTSAADQGGAIILGSLQSNNTNIAKPLKATLTSSTFSGNTAGKQGGAVLISNQANLRAFTCTLTDVSVFNNSAGQLSGGGGFSRSARSRSSVPHSHRTSSARKMEQQQARSGSKLHVQRQ